MIDTLIFDTVSTDKGGGRWDVVGSCSWTAFGSPAGRASASELDELAMTSEMPNFDLEAWVDLRRRLKVAGRTGQPLDAATMKQLAEIGSIIGGKQSVDQDSRRVGARQGLVLRCADGDSVIRYVQPRPAPFRDHARSCL